MSWNQRSLSLNRENLVEDVLSAWEGFKDESFEKLSISFVNESGSDADGITTDTYTEFFYRLSSHEHMDCPSRAMLPAKNVDPECTDVWKCGYVIAQCISDKRLIPFHSFPLCFYKFLSRNEEKIDLQDLQEFDPSLARSLRLALICDDVSEWMLDFSAIGLPERPVTNENREEYVNAAVQYELITSRLPLLEAIREAFYYRWRFLSQKSPETEELSDIMGRFSPHEMRHAFCGKPSLSASEILAGVDYYELSQGGRENDKYFVQMLHYWEEHSPENLTRFIRFLTGLSTMPPLLVDVSERPRLNPQCDESYKDKLPAAHLCFNMIDCPTDYPSMESMRKAFELSFEYSGSGSGIYDD